jgi:hypothetical protein
VKHLFKKNKQNCSTVPLYLKNGAEQRILLITSCEMDGFPVSVSATRLSDLEAGISGKRAQGKAEITDITLQFRQTCIRSYTSCDRTVLLFALS